MNPEDKATAYRRPLFAAGLTAVAVTAMSLGLVWWLSLLCVVLLIGWLFFRRALLCAAVALLFFVSAMGFRHWYVLPTAHLNGERDTLTAVVVAQPTYGDMYLVRVTDSTLLRRGTRVMLLCNGEEAPRPGGTVTADLRLYAVEDNQTYYVARGAFVCAFADGDEDDAIRVVGRGHSPSSDIRLRVVRALTAAPRRYLGDVESGIVAALCFGERTFLSADTAAAFQGSGLSHLLVVSGLHLSMVVLAVRQLVRRTGMRLTCLITILAAWLFAWLVGFSPSIVRAAVMCTLWLVGCLAFCRSDGLNSLGFAALILLAVHPYTLYNVSFQLSFAATLGVLLLTPHLVSRYDLNGNSMRHKVLNGASVSVSALLFTLPIAAYHYGGFPLTAVIANLLALPVSGAILLLGWVGALCGLVPFLGWLSQTVLWMVHYLVRYLEWVARVCSPSWAWLTVSAWWEWWLLLGVCATVAFAIYHRVPFRRVAAAVLSLTILTVGVGYPLTVAPVSLTVVSSDNEGGLVLRQGGRCALLLTRADELREVTYETAPFTPDVIVVGESPATAETQWGQFSAAQVLWAGGMPARTDVKLWKDCHFTVCENGWWRLNIQNHILWIATDPTVTPPTDGGTCLYVGGTPVHPPSADYLVVCSDWWLRRYRPALTGRETFVIEQPLTLIPHRGEWRTSIWL